MILGEWKMSKIIFVLKKDNTIAPSNYRGISFINAIYKLCGKIINDDFFSNGYFTFSGTDRIL